MPGVKIPPDIVLTAMDELSLQHIDSLRSLCATARFVAMLDPRYGMSAPCQSHIETMEDAEDMLAAVVRRVEARFAARAAARAASLTHAREGNPIP